MVSSKIVPWKGASGGRFMEEEYGTGTYARETREARKMGTAWGKARFSSRNQEGEKNLEEGKWQTRRKTAAHRMKSKTLRHTRHNWSKNGGSQITPLSLKSIQQKLQARRRSHRDEAFRQTLTVLERSGELKNMQPSEHDVETALMAIVGMKNK